MRPVAALAVLLLLAAPEAGAQISAGVGVEMFGWSEKTNPSVSESGPLFSLSLGLAAPRRGAFRLAYRGHGRIGIADYHGSFLTAPRVSANTTTVFGTLSHEAQLRARSPWGAEGVAALGFDWWHRQLSARQQEDYQTVSFSIRLERADTGVRGWSGGGGVRVPLSVREDAHFTDLGFDRNPKLDPGGTVGLLGQVRYRFGPRFSCVGSYDGYHLEKSKAVSLTVGGHPTATASQPETSTWMLGVGVEYSR